MKIANKKKLLKWNCSSKEQYQFYMLQLTINCSLTIFNIIIQDLCLCMQKEIQKVIREIKQKSIRIRNSQSLIQIISIISRQHTISKYIIEMSKKAINYNDIQIFITFLEQKFHTDKYLDIQGLINQKIKLAKKKLSLPQNIQSSVAYLKLIFDEAKGEVKQKDIQIKAFQRNQQFEILIKQIIFEYNIQDSNTLLQMIVGNAEEIIFKTEKKGVISSNYHLERTQINMLRSSPQHASQQFFGNSLKIQQEHQDSNQQIPNLLQARQVLVILFKEKIDKIQLCLNEQNKKPVQFANNKTGNLQFSSFLLVLKDGENLLQNFFLLIGYKQKSIFIFNRGVQKKILLKDKISWNDEKSVCFLYDDQSQRQPINQLSALIKSSKNIWNMKKTHQQINLWWKTFQKQFQSIVRKYQLKLESSFGDILKEIILALDKGAVQYNKYLFWLLTRISSQIFWKTLSFGNQLLKIGHKDIDQIIINENLGDSRSIDLIYLRALYYGMEKRDKTQKLLIMNISNQTKQTIKQMLLLCSQREFQAYKAIIVKEFITNSEITIKEFIKYYFNLQKQIISREQHAKKHVLQQSDYTFSIFLNLKNKCISIGKGRQISLIQASQFEEDLLEVFQRSQLNHGMYNNIFRFQGEVLVKYIIQSKQIGIYQPNLCSILLKIARLNLLKINKISNIYPALFIPPFKEFQELLKNLISTKKQQMVLYIQKQNKKDNLKNIISFIAEYFKEDAQLKEIIQQKIDKFLEFQGQDLIQLSSLLNTEKIVVIKDTLLLIIDDKKISNLYRTNSQEKIMFSNHSALNNITINYALLKDITSSQIKFNSFRLQAESTYLNTKSIAINPDLTIAILKIKKLTDAQYSSVILSALDIIQSLHSQIKLQRIWIYQLSKQIQKVSFQQFAECIRQKIKQADNITIKSIISILIVASHLFENKIIDLIENKDIWNGWRANKRFYRMQILQQYLQQQKKLSINLLYWILKSYSSKQDKNNVQKISSLSSIQQVSNKYEETINLIKNQNSKKEIIVYLFKNFTENVLKISNLIKEINANDAFINEIQKNRLFSMHDLRDIMLVMIPNSQKNNKSEIMQAITFIDRLIQKSQSGQHSNDHSIKIPSAYQNIRKIFYAQSLKYNQQSPEVFVFDKLDNFKNMYSKLKRIKDNQTYLFITNQIKQIGIYFSKFLESNFDVIIRLIFNNPLEQEITKLKNYLYSTELSNVHIHAFIQFIILANNWKEAYQFFKDHLKRTKSLKLNSFNLVKSIQNTHQKASKQDKKRLYDVFDFLLQNITIDKQSINQFLAASKMLEIDHLFLPFIKKICQSYFQIYQKTAKTQHEFHKNLLLLYHEIQEQQKIQVILDIYLQILKSNNKLHDIQFEEKIINYWNAIVNDPRSLQLIKSSQKKSIQQIQKKIEEKLQRNEVTIGEIKKIRINQKKIKSKFTNIFKIVSQKYKKIEEVERDLSKINSLIQMFPSLQYQRDQIKGIMTRKQETNLLQIMNVMQNFRQFQQISIDVQSFRKLQLWGNREIKSKNDLKQKWDNCKQILISLSGAIQQMSFIEYLSTFYKLNDECIDHILKTSKDLAQKIKFYNKQINQFQSIIDTWTSYQHFKCQVVGQGLTQKQIQYSDFLVNFQKQKNGQKSEHIVSKIVELMRNIMNYVLKTINSKSQYQQILAILKATFQCKSLFQKIQESSVDENKLNNLKQFSNQMQNSIIRPESVMKFRNVCQYWKNVYRSNKITKAIEYIFKIISLKVNLKECIMDSKSIEIILFQKLLEANDRTNYFRVEVEALLKCSCLKLVMVDDKIDVQVIIKDERFQNHPLDFRRLNSLKQKSLLYDFSLLEGKQQANVDSLTIYCQLFKQVQAIRRISNQISGYAYKPSKLISSIQILNSNLQIIIKKKEELQNLKKEWIGSIRQICSKSYLFTHFVGQKLNSFLENLKKFIYQPSLKHIINQSREQFYEQIIKEDTNRILFDSTENIIENYRKISQLFIKQQNQMQQERQQSNSIVLITSTPSQFNQHIINQNQGSSPRYNQIFYCHQHSSQLQIQFFLFRSLIDYRNHYFILGVTKLNENLKSSLCKMISRLKEQRQTQFKRSNLVFIDDKQSGNVVYSYLSRPKRFSIKKILSFTISKERMEQLQQIYAKNIKNVELVTSNRAGLGKTYYVQQKIGNKQLVNHFPIAGTIDVKNLLFRLKKLSFAKGEALLIKLGHVINKHLLEIFLESIVLYRGFFAQQYIYLPETTKIFIQIQNVVQPLLLNGEKIPRQYYILHFLQISSLEHHISSFNASLINFGSASLQDLFVYYYFNLLQTNQINRVNTLFLQFTHDLAPSNQKKVELIIKYYLSQTNLNSVSFITYSNLMKMLFSIIQTFSNNQILRLLLHNNQPFLSQMNLQNYRQSFLAACIKNAICLMEQLQSSHNFKETQGNIRNFRQIIQDIPLLILPDFARQAFKFVTLDNDRVPNQIKLFNALQNPQTNKQIQSSAGDLVTINNICKKNSISEMRGQNLKKQIQQILQSISRDTKFKQFIKVDQLPPQNNYVLTLDNFRKMCFIILRERCGIPCIIQGQSGVGKTALINYLSKKIFKNQLLILNVHAGIHQQQLNEFVNTIKISARKIQQQNEIFKLNYNSQSFQKRLWVFLDQYNTCDEYGYIKQMVIEHRFMGQKLPTCIQFLAACNPYRYFETKDYIRTGLRRNRYGRQYQQKQLAFKVNPPPFSMIQLAWNYLQLTQEQNQCYIISILDNNKFDPNLKKKLAHAIVKIHENIKEKVQISAVSLRDVERVKELYQWFRGYLKLIKDESRQTRYSNSAVLALIFCYALRFHNQETRKHMFTLIEQSMKLNRGDCQQIFEKQQNIFAKSILDSKKLKRDKIALNKALKENIFVTFVCVMNKIPVLIVGNPGSSKSLTVNYLASALTGASSQAKICKKYPQINMIYFQGSESSTSAGVQEVFHRAEQYHSDKYINCIYFDEIGLAQMSVHNPLKVLHSWLQIHGKRIASFIGISNHELDASKMSRFLILNRTQPDLQELVSTAKGIFSQYEPDKRQQENYQSTLKEIASYYHKFITKNAFESFFGLRDYYNYVKQICKGILKEPKQQQRFFNFLQKRVNLNIRKHIERAIEINFDGKEDSVRKFKSFLPQIINQTASLFKPLQLIDENLQDNTSRCLLLIVEGDTLMPFIKNALDQAKENKCVVYYGSAFAEDQKSEEYNYQITNKIISYMAKGNTILFKDPNNSIQSSLYQLFNKAYTEFGENKMCRIAVGANSNLQCSVHEDFRAIIVIQSRKVAALNLPFLNRFQKHRFQLESLLQDRHHQILKRLIQWINKITSFCQNGILKRQNIIINSSQRSLLTLILKHKDLDNEDALNQIKLDLLKNRTTDFLISLISQESQSSQSLLRELEELSIRITPFEDRKQDLIIYTYDQYIHLQDNQTDFLTGSHVIHLLEISSEKMLKQSLKLGFDREKFNKITIIVDYFKSYQFIQQLLYLAKQLKEQSRTNKKQIIFICQLHRFNLIIPKEDINQNTVNISYLHKYQQYFCQDFSTKITHGFGGSELTFFSLLFKINQFENDVLKSIHSEACTTININLEDEEMDIRYYDEKLNELGENKMYWKQLNKFMKPVLDVKLKREDYSIFHNNTNELINCSNIYQIIKIIIKSLSKKLILQFLKIIVPNNSFLKLFFERNYLYSESEEKIRQICRQQMQEILKYHSERLRQTIHDIIRQNEQQVDITIIKNVGNLNLKRLFKETKNQLYKLKKQGIISREIDKIQEFNYFKAIFESSLKRYPSLQKLINQEAVRADIISQLLCFVKENKIQSKTLIWLTNIFHNTCYFETIEYLIYVLQFSEEQQLNPIVQLASIITRHTQSSIQERKAFYFSKNNLNDGLKQVGAFILSFAYQLSRLANASQFKSIEGFMDYIKQLGENQSVEELQKLLQFQVNNQYYQMLKLMHFCEKNQNGPQLFQKFIEIGNHQSIYKNILRFCQIFKSQGGNNQEIEAFLSYSFYQYWISHIVNTSSSLEAQECISNFASMCNNSIEFANRSHIFFQSVFPFNDLSVQDSLKQRLNAVLREGSGVNKLKSTVSKYLHNSNNFSLSLFTYFYRVIQEILSANKQGVILSNSQIFSKYFSEATSEPSIKNYFKLAFIKKYLSIYILSIAHTTNTYEEIDKALNSMSSIKQQIFTYLNISLRKILKNNQIKERFIDIKRCNWIQDVFPQYGGQQKWFQRFFMDTQSIILHQNKSYSESLFFHLKSNKELNKHQLLTFLLKNYNKGYGKFLSNISPILLFLSKLRRMINLRMTRYELENQTIQQWIISKDRINLQEAKQLRSGLKEFLYSLQNITKKSLQLKDTSSLSNFVLYHHESQKSNLAISIKELIYQYNAICEEYLQLIRQTYPKNNLLRSKSNRMNPFSLKSASYLLALPLQEDLQARAVKYSYYSLQKQPCQMCFSIEQIQSSVLQNMKKFYLLIQQPKQFLTVKLVGEDISLLQSFRKFRLKSLKQLNKLQIIESSFTSQKINDRDNYIKFCQRILHQIQLLMRILRRSSNIPEHPIEIEIKRHQNLQKNIKQLINRPFSQISCEGIISLYQVVQYRTFQNISIMLGEQFKSGNADLRKKRQSNAIMIKNLKNNQQQSHLPTYEQFKRALYRFIGRKVISSKINPEDLLSKYLCDEMDCWDYDLDIKTIKRIKQEFRANLDIKLAYLGSLIKEIPYNEDKQLIPDEPSVRTIKKKPNLKKI